MTMNKLIVIGVSLAALAIAAWFLRSPPASDGKSPAVTRALPATAATPEPAQPAPAVKPSEPAAPVPASEPARAPSARPIPTAEEPSQPAAAAPTDEAQQLAQCRALAEREHKAEQLARAAETRDAAWAHTTEQRLHEYFVRRFRTTPIEVTRIDCKSTFCEITGQGFVPASGAEFRQALTDIGQESWSDFSWSSFSDSVKAGKVTYTAEVRRKQSYASAVEQNESPERTACNRLSGRRQQRERAALEAEPRDTGWADPMEQLLRQHLAAQLTRQDVELDISCRTTFCRIKAKGQAQEALFRLQKVMSAVESEPWANLRFGPGGGIAGYSDHWTANYMLLRK
jgi:uncharacterized lipoprotein YmbA